jgi:sterol desaturase/sphingolipid hydroxylase (fatty acid hydroxylase superfamily)
VAVVLLWSVYIGFGVVCTIAELARPAHKLRYRKSVLLDGVAFGFFQLAVVPVAAYASEPIARAIHMPAAVLELPLALRIVAVYLVADLGSYWMHRLMHTRHVWRIHRWHHSATQVYWFSGVRATIPQQILFNLPFAIVAPLLAGAPAWVFVAIGIENIVRNHWMHVNFAWRSNWLEWVLVTPRYHHLHHATDADLHDANYGSLFTFWDRLFGTYVDPDGHRPKHFGTGDKKERDTVLLLLGV